MPVYLERIYDTPEHTKGYRVLADRLWPRGISRERAALNEWCKALAPSTALRQWYAHDPEKWPEFSRRYARELAQEKEEARALLARSGKKPLILLTGTKDMAHTHALILKRFLEKL